MKSGNFDEMMDKFYAGTASAEEINLLQSEKLIDDLDNLYVEALSSEREQRMDWEFEDFMKEIPAAKIVSLPAQRVWVKRMMAAAAMIVIIMSAYVFWPKQNQPKEIANVIEINKQVENKPIPNNTEPVESQKDAQPDEESIKMQPKENTNYEAKNTKNVKSNSISPSAKENVTEKKNDEDFFVMVNGKAITNEEDAIAITRESL
ncbi:MAG: hypothetical protein ABIN25_04680, partial [Ginsengibacter sp.]